MHEELMEEILTEENAEAAWLAVKRNGGAPGIDRMRTSELGAHIRKHWESIRQKLLKGEYLPTPVKRVEIPKPNGGGTRMLGIPTVVDRWIQQMLLQKLQPIFDPTFSKHSYGFRPGRSAHDAVKAAQGFVREGKEWVVDMDITKFFDYVNHDILMNRVGKKIRDKRVMKLIGRYLRAGIMIEGVVQPKKKALRKEAQSHHCSPISTWTRWTRNWNNVPYHSAVTPMTVTYMSAVNERRKGY